MPYPKIIPEAIQAHPRFFCRTGFDSTKFELSHLGFGKRTEFQAILVIKYLSDQEGDYE